MDQSSSQVSALPFQVAGRGGLSDTRGRQGILVSRQGHALKQVQAPPQGPREVEFYQKIYSSDDPECQKWRELAPKYHGIEMIVGASGESTEHLVLENLTSGMTRPCVMDIKPGRVTWPPEATKEKIAKASSTKAGTRLPFGFGVSGMVLNTDQGLKKLAKPFGHALDATSVHTILENYLVDKNANTIELAKSFLEKLRDMENFFESQTTFHNFGCSMLFVYEFGDATSAQIRLIDFVHSFPGNEKIDENFLFGLQNVRLLFEDFISVDNN